MITGSSPSGDPVSDKQTWFGAIQDFAGSTGIFQIKQISSLIKPSIWCIWTCHYRISPFNRLQSQTDKHDLGLYRTFLPLGDQDTSRLISTLLYPNPSFLCLFYTSSLEPVCFFFTYFKLPERVGLGSCYVMLCYIRGIWRILTTTRSHPRVFEPLAELQTSIPAPAPSRGCAKKYPPGSMAGPYRPRLEAMSYLWMA